RGVECRAPGRRAASPGRRIGRQMTMRRTKPVPTKDDILKTGLLNQWYLVCRSSDLADKPLGLMRLGRRIALWRDASGGVHAVDDLCPDRRALLSKGHVVEDNLACGYHGLRVNGEGVVIEVPPVENCPLVGRKLVDAYPAREAAGAVFLYFSDG